MNQKEAEDGQFKVQICARHNSTKNMKKQKQPGVCGVGQMVSVLAFYFDDPSLNPAESTYSFYSLKLFDKDENKRKRGRELHIYKNESNHH